MSLAEAIRGSDSLQREDERRSTFAGLRTQSEEAWADQPEESGLPLWHYRRPRRGPLDDRSTASSELAPVDTLFGQPEPGKGPGTGPVVVTPQPRDIDRFTLLQQWEGCVNSLGDDEFRASLFDLTNPATPEEEATFDMEEVAPGDRNLVRPGAFFYWSVGYRTREGARERVSAIKFRRLPHWTRKTLAKVEVEADRLMTRFGATP